MSNNRKTQQRFTTRVYYWFKAQWTWIPFAVFATLMLFKDVLDPFPIQTDQLLSIALTLVVAYLTQIKNSLSQINRLHQQTVENIEIDTSVRKAGFKRIHSQMSPTYFDELCSEADKEITIFTTWIGQYELFYQNFSEAINNPEIKIRFLLLHPRSSVGQARAGQLHKNEAMLVQQLEFVRDTCYSLNARNVEIRLYHDIPPFSLYAVDVRQVLFGVYWTHSLSTMQTQFELKGDDTPLVNNIRNTFEHVWFNADRYVDFPPDHGNVLSLRFAS